MEPGLATDAMSRLIAHQKISQQSRPTIVASINVELSRDPLLRLLRVPQDISTSEKARAKHVAEKPLVAELRSLGRAAGKEFLADLVSDKVRHILGWKIESNRRNRLRILRDGLRFVKRDRTKE